MSLTRRAIYNGSSWPMGDLDPQVFLDEALVPTYPDLRGAMWVERRDTATNEITFEFQKRSGKKG